MTGTDDRSSQHLTFAPHVLREYALLADGCRGALVGPEGAIGWLCAPTWDSPAAMSLLVGGAGLYAVAPVAPFVWGGYYEPRSLIWRSRWVSNRSVVECREALARPAENRRVVLLRRIEVVSGDAEVDVVLDVRADFGQQPMTVVGHDDAVWSLRSGGLQCRWTGVHRAERDGDGRLRSRLSLRQGQTHDLVLEIGDRPWPELPDAGRLWQQTERAWTDDVPGYPASAAPRDAEQAHAVLRGLTAPSGGMVAAATLGLPERAKSGRNYDYRYVWLRDQAYAGLAVSVTRPDPLLDAAVSWTTDRVLDHGDQLRPAYQVDGGELPEQRELHLPGYPGGRVVVGNWVRGQFQLDSLGEILQLYTAASRFDHLNLDDDRALRTVVALIRDRWRQPDAGVWELGDDWWVHSRLSCVAGLRAVAPYRPVPERPELAGLAEAILAETDRRGRRPDGAWRQRPGVDGTDAALLLPPVRGALPADDPRTVATMRAVATELGEEGFLYRYAADGKPLGKREGAFLMCGFAMALAQWHAGNRLSAVRWFERSRGACGSPGLFTEELDIQQRQLRGNLPQAFVHALLLECSQRLDVEWVGGPPPDHSTTATSSP